MASEANLAGVNSTTVKAAPGSLIVPLETDLAAVRGLVVEAPLAFALQGLIGAWRQEVTFLDGGVHHGRLQSLNQRSSAVELLEHFLPHVELVA